MYKSFVLALVTTGKSFVIVNCANDRTMVVWNLQCVNWKYFEKNFRQTTKDKAHNINIACRLCVRG